MRLILIKNL